MDKLKNVEWFKIGKGALIAGSAAALTFLYHWGMSQDFGPSTPVIVAGLSVLINFLQKLATDPAPEAK